ncbi:MAG TPA: TonB-dependent receptor [Vicinamibacterales bacterium]|jgi:hypothetical protein
MFAWKRWLAIAALAALVIALAPSAALAQTRSEITGVIKDGTGAVLPGVTVTLSSPNMVGGDRTVVSGHDGIYRFTDLPLGVYEVAATLQGFRTVHRPGLQVQFGTTVTIDLVLQVGGVEETVTVSGATPVIDVTTAASTTKIEESFLQNLPAGGQSRRPNEIMSLAPGVTTQRTAHGGIRDANNIMVDGMSSSLPGGGNIATSVLSYDWMAEVQVVALGANAEYGEFTGTVSNMIMRSGSNNFSGLASYFTTRQSWLGKNTGDLSPALQAKFTPARLLQNYDTNYQVGGPIKKDKVFFFGGGEYFRNSAISSGALPGPDGTGIPNSENWPRYLAKVNWAVSKALKLEGLVEHDNESIEPNGTSASSAADAMTMTHISKTMYNGRLTWTINDKTLVEVRGGGLKLFQEFPPYPPNTISGPSSHKDTVTGITTGNAGSFSSSTQSRTSMSGSLTKWVTGFLGTSHELKFGLDYEHTELLNTSGIPGGRLYSDINGKPNQVNLFDGTTADAISTRTTVYAQDAWTLTDRLTLQPGVRVSLDRGSIPAASNVYKTNPVDWRFGFAWDLLGNHKTLVRGHYGRFHETVVPGMVNFLDFSKWSPTITAKVNANGSFTELTRSVMPGNLSISSNVSQPYMDQITIAVERELLPDFGVTAQFVRRDWGSLLAFVDTNSQWAPVQKQDPGPDNVLGTSDDGAMLTVYNLLNPGKSILVFSNPSDASRKYTAIMLIAKKRFSHNWQLLASYTRSNAEGTVGNTAGTSTGTAAEVSQTGQWANPNAMINAYGPGIYDCPNQFSFNGTYRVSHFGGFNLSASYRYATGQPWSRTVTIRGLAQGNQSVRVEKKGTQVGAPVNSLDIRVEKTVNLGSPRRNVGVYVDAFNVLNRGWQLGGGVVEASGATYGLPTAWSPARQFQVGARLTF